MTKNSELTSVLKELKQITGVSLNLSKLEETDTTFAAEQLRKLCTAYKEKYNKTHFLQSILRGELSTHDLNDQARKFHINPASPRILFLLEVTHPADDTTLSVLKNIFPSQTGTFIFSISDLQLAVLYPFSEKNSNESDLTHLALSIIDTLNMEALTSVKIAYAPCIQHLSELQDAYNKATLALKIGKLFNSEQNIFSYNQLSTGRLIYHLPVSVCQDFLNEVFLNQVPDSLDAELLSTINRFFQNNLNIAETARQLHMHRNTLIYRIEQVEKRTGLDLRNFEDAMTFKIALMVMNYIHTKEI